MNKKVKTMWDRLPETLFDSDGYPTKEWIKFIKEYVPDESLTIHKFVECILMDGWWAPEWGYILKRRKNGKRTLELHTGGWSGNEETISAIKSNIYLTHFGMRCVKWITGGHYYFEIYKNK